MPGKNLASLPARIPRRAAVAATAAAGLVLALHAVVASGEPPSGGPGTEAGPVLVETTRLRVNTLPGERYVASLPRSVALAHIRALAERSLMEEQWAHLPGPGLWVEIGINEAVDASGPRVETDRALLERLAGTFEAVHLYHFHPYRHFGLPEGGIGPHHWTRAASLETAQLDGVGLALPSPADIRTTIEAVHVLPAGASARLRHFVVSPFGVISYGPTERGRRQLAHERGHPLASLQRGIELSATLRRTPLNIANTLGSDPQLTVGALLAILCAQMSSEAFAVTFEAHGDDV